MKICFITSGRADFGILRSLIITLKNTTEHQVQVVATGTHFSARFGNSVNEIRGAGVDIDFEIPLDLESEENSSRMHEMARLTIGLGDAYAELNPDMVIILGDRYEMLTAAVATIQSDIPIGHIHGGEETKGSVDNLYRHAITKLASLHFVSTEVYRRRVIQMGEAPSTVFNVGSLGVGNAKAISLLSKIDLCKMIGFDFDERNLLVTFHPATLGQYDSSTQFRNLLAALDYFTDRSIVVTYPNSDKGGNELIEILKEYSAKRSEVKIVKSLGSQAYLSLAKLSSVVVGNSSSGIIEVPSLSVPTVNIGDRQDGRVMPESVINCPPLKDEIIHAIQLAESPGFKKLVSQVVNPYDAGNASENIASIFKKIKIGKISQKSFVDA